MVLCVGSQCRSAVFVGTGSREQRGDAKTGGPRFATVIQM